MLHATKNIKAGEELFWDYNHDCFCKNCWSTFILCWNLDTRSALNAKIANN
jgi:hypothetical protein